MGDTITPIDIEEIMKDIRREIEESGYTDDMLSFRDVDLDATGFHFQEFDEESFRAELRDLNHRWDIQSYRSVGGGLFGFVKKVISKLTQFYIVPIVEDQNQFNASVVKTMNLMECYIQDQNATIQALKLRVKQLEEAQSKEEDQQKEQSSGEKQQKWQNSDQGQRKERSSGVKQQKWQNSGQGQQKEQSSGQRQKKWQNSGQGQRKEQSLGKKQQKGQTSDQGQQKGQSSSQGKG